MDPLGSALWNVSHHLRVILGEGLVLLWLSGYETPLNSYSSCPSLRETREKIIPGNLGICCRKWEFPVWPCKPIAQRERNEEGGGCQVRKGNREQKTYFWCVLGAILLQTLAKSVLGLLRALIQPFISPTGQNMAQGAGNRAPDRVNWSCCAAIHGVMLIFITEPQGPARSEQQGWLGFAQGPSALPRGIPLI